MLTPNERNTKNISFHETGTLTLLCRNLTMLGSRQGRGPPSATRAYSWAVGLRVSHPGGQVNSAEQPWGECLLEAGTAQCVTDGRGFNAKIPAAHCLLRASSKGSAQASG